MTNNDELAMKLKARYSEPETPKCRICGAEMSIQRAGGGSIVYGCDGRVDGDGYAFKGGRSFADKHYEQSRETVYNHGDADVLALLAERDADKKRIAELEALTAEHDKRLIAYAAIATKNASEERTLSVKLPKTIWYEHDDLARDVAVLEKRLVRKALREACAAAGIKLEVVE